MKTMNAAERIREMMGCYNIMMHHPEKPAKKKKISYGSILKAAFDKRRFEAKKEAEAARRKATFSGRVFTAPAFAGVTK